MTIKLTDKEKDDIYYAIGSFIIELKQEVLQMERKVETEKRYATQEEIEKRDRLNDSIRQYRELQTKFYKKMQRKSNKMILGVVQWIF